MADRTPEPDAHEDTGLGLEHEPTDHVPRWVKISGAIGPLPLLLAVLVMLLPGGHGPGRHSPSGDAGSNVLSIERALQRP